MAVYTKNTLSGSTNGKPIKVVATATLGTTIHTTPAGTTSLDEIWLYAFNSDTLDRTLTIEYGGATAPDQNIVLTVPKQAGLVLVVPGLLLQNSLVVTAFASAANVVTISGYVNRIA
jgi:hypothetical protein